MMVSVNISAVAQETATINGSSDLNKVKYESLCMNGGLIFNDLTVKNLLVVNGRIQGKNLICTTLKSNGSFNVDGFRACNVHHNGSFLGKNIEITGDAEFNGNVETTNGTLNTVKISATQATFINTYVTGNILVKKAHKGWEFFGFKESQSSPQILEFKGKSVVLSDVVFEEAGEVHIFDNAKIKGKIFFMGLI